MNEYIIITDSACDISADTLSAWGVKYASLTFKFSDSDTEYKNEDLSATEFYQKMRDGASAKTAAINIETFKDIFRPELKEGRDVLYLGFSSGLSNTYNAGRLAAEELLEEFPDRRVIAIDTLCASAGQGLLVYLATKQKEAGASIEETARFVMENRANVCLWFTVDDLKYLKRGGRVSPTAAFVGGIGKIWEVLGVFGCIAASIATVCVAAGLSSAASGVGGCRRWSGQGAAMRLMAAIRTATDFYGRIRTALAAKLSASVCVAANDAMSV